MQARRISCCNVGRRPPPCEQSKAFGVQDRAPGPTLPASRTKERSQRSLPDFGCTLDDGGERQGKTGKALGRIQANLPRFQTTGQSRERLRTGPRRS